MNLPPSLCGALGNVGVSRRPRSRPRFAGGNGRSAGRDRAAARGSHRHERSGLHAHSRGRGLDESLTPAVSSGERNPKPFCQSSAAAPPPRDGRPPAGRHRDDRTSSGTHSPAAGRGLLSPALPQRWSPTAAYAGPAKRRNTVMCSMKRTSVRRATHTLRPARVDGDVASWVLSAAPYVNRLS